MRTAKTLIGLGGCPVWSESSLGAHTFCWFCHVALTCCRYSLLDIWPRSKCSYVFTEKVSKLSFSHHRMLPYVSVSPYLLIVICCNHSYYLHSWSTSLQNLLRVDYGLEHWEIPVSIYNISEFLFICFSVHRQVSSLDPQLSKKKRGFILVVISYEIYKQLTVTHFNVMPCHDKTCLCHMQTTKTQISCLDSIIPVLAKSKISKLQLVTVAEQASLSLTWSQPPKTGFPMTWLIWSIWISLKIMLVIC